MGGIALGSNGWDWTREKSQLQAYHDLDPLAGTWSNEQAIEFSNAVTDFERVDEKLWP